MERKSYVCRNLKHHSLGKIHHNHPSWENCSIECETSTTTIVDLVAAGGSRFSWPPRTYSCSFCKREFRSAQALGGHMNVHRRDRARLRQSSPPHPPPPKDHHHSNNLLNLNLHSNPNPNISSTSSSLPSFSPGETLKRGGTGDTSVGLAKMKMERNVFGYGELEGFEQDRKGCRVRLDLEIGVGRDLKEDLDLELRLGYS